MSRRMQTSWKLFLQAAQAGAVGRAVGHGTSKSQAGSLPRTCPHPSAKPPRLTGAEAGGDQAKKSGRPQHRDVLKEVEAASREEPGKSPKSARTKRSRKVRWLRAHRCSRGSCRSPCKKLPWHKCSGRAGHTNGSSPARGWCVFREAEIWGDEWFGTGFTCASTAFASKTRETTAAAQTQRGDVSCHQERDLGGLTSCSSKTIQPKKASLGKVEVDLCASA